MTHPLSYTPDFIRSLRTTAWRLRRCTRKIIFLHRLWCPAFARWAPAPEPVPLVTPEGPVQPTSPLSPPPSPPPPPPPAGFRLATWNVFSLRKKYVAVADTVLAQGLDMLIITESFHQSSSDVAVRRSTPDGYTAVDCPRPAAAEGTGRGGGIVILHRSALSVRRIPLASSPSTFEALAISIASSRGPLTILAAYRPGSVYPPPALFFNQFAAVLEQFALYNTQLIVTGDLNLHLQDPSLPECVTFHSITEQFGLTQHVAEPTHRDGGWLDVIITRDDCVPTDIFVHPPTISDHGLVTATIPFLCVAPSYRTRQVRDWRNLDRTAFLSALLAIPAVSDPSILDNLSR